MSKPRLFIGIPCYQENERLARTLAFLQERTVLPHILEVHVAKQSVVKNKNALLAEARKWKTDYVCLCDDDIEPETEWDSKLVHTLEQVERRLGTRIGQTTPRLIYPDGRIFNAWINVYIDPIQKGLLLDGYDGKPDNEVYHTLAIVGALAGTLTIFSRALLDAVDWTFDDRYERSQFEDFDQSFTCRDLNFSLLYNGLVEVTHHTMRVNPRASEDNFAKLRDKWGLRTDLTMVIPASPETVAAVALRQDGTNNYVSQPNIVTRMWNLVRKKPIHRLKTGIKVLRSSGMRGVRAHVRRIQLESMGNNQR
ncbi:MAG TPA: hypothetical protein VMF69_15430 [Gemmataceae bacterium]|nr:hypothetical protein [Gemmataceae bacterium]